MKILLFLFLLLSPSILYAEPKAVTGTKDIVIDQLSFSGDGSTSVSFTVYLVDSDGKEFKYSSFKVYTSTLFPDIVNEAYSKIRVNEKIVAVEAEPIVEP